MASGPVYDASQPVIFVLIQIHCTLTDAPDLKLMLLSQSWTQASINTLKTNPRAIRLLQFSHDEGEMTKEEQALTQAGKELLENTMHQIDEVETCTGTTIQ